jgi:hypothetical protein
MLAGQAPMPQVRAIASGRLRSLQTRMQSGVANPHAQLMAADIKRFLERPMEPTRPIPAPEIPPGAPIGSLEEDWCGMEPGARSAFYPPLVK